MAQWSSIDGVGRATISKYGIAQSTLCVSLPARKEASIHDHASTIQAVGNCLVTAVMMLLARFAKASANPSSVLLHALLRNRLAHTGPDRLLLPSSDPFSLVMGCLLRIKV